MKNIKLIIIAITMIASYSLTAQVTVRNGSSNGDPSAMLNVISSEKGILIPRMTQAEIEAIESPAIGLSVFNTDDSRFYFYDDGAGEWKEIAISAG
ncbi:MAG: hypothetical protein DRJ05_13485, partial [Bacteroidetes bacterium]